MIRQLLPPLIAIALASAVYMPTTRAAEPVVAVPVDPVVTLDPLEDMLAALAPKARLVGRSGNLGYVILTTDVGYYLRAQPNGQLRISKATAPAIHAYAKANGWRI